MTPEQKTIVKTTWAKVVPIADTAASLFYEKLFEIDPATKPLFKSADMSEQRKKLMGAISLVVASLDNFEPVIPILENLGRKHVAYGVTNEHYGSVASALLWTLEQGLGEAWSQSTKDAWTAAYTDVASVMQSAAKQPVPIGV